MQHMHYTHIWVEKCTCNKVQCAVHAVGACVLRWRFVLYTNKALCKRTHTFRMCDKNKTATKKMNCGMRARFEYTKRMLNSKPYSAKRNDNNNNYRNSKIESKKATTTQIQTKNVH